MCILKAFSTDHSFQEFARSTSIPILSCHEKGEIRSQSRGTVHEMHRVSFNVSDRDWDDFQGQVQDAIGFLRRWESALREFVEEFNPEFAYLDFPLYSRLSDDIANQNDHLPKELIVLAGRIGLGIEMAIYAKDIE